MPDRLTPTSSTPGAVTGDDYMDDVADEILNLWNRTIIKLDATGDGTTYTGTIVPAIVASPTDGMLLLIRFDTNSAGPCTFNGSALRDNGGSAFAANEIVANAWYLFFWHSGDSHWRALNLF